MLYDSLYRLTTETVTADPHNHNFVNGYTYDAVGNRKQWLVNSVSANAYTYDADDRLGSDQYDANGNTTSSGGVSDAYDFENHLIQKGAVTVVYDGDGNRVSETVAGVTTNYLVDTLNPTGYAQVVDEMQSGTVTRTYSYGLERISEKQPSGTSFYSYDGHGSVRQLTNLSGTVTDTYDYDAFGNLIDSAGTTPNNYLFAGEQFDPALGLYYNRARYLSTTTGRFWSMDTRVGNDRDPLSLHKYLYAESNPVDHLDPSGHEIDLVSILVVAAIVVTLSTLAVTPVASEARVEVHFDEIPAFPRAHHAYILLKGPGRPTLQFRGGPTGGWGCGSSDAVSGISGSDTSSDCGHLTEDGSNVPFLPGAIDYPKGPGDNVAQMGITTLRNDSYNSLQGAFKNAADGIERMHLPYDPVVQNSNAFAYTLLVYASLLAPEPPVWTPGWGDLLLAIP